MQDKQSSLATRLKRKYVSQKASAKRRGIEWQFTFDSWLDFWKDDIEARGRQHHELCMQRFGDKGPYHPDNVRKDYPRRNAITAGINKRARNTYRPGKDHDWEGVYCLISGKG